MLTNMRLFIMLMTGPCFVLGAYDVVCQDPVYCASSTSSSSVTYEPCFNTTCHNGGTCITYGTNYKCLCRTNTYGEHCEAASTTVTYNETMELSECIGLCDETNNNPTQWSVECPNAIYSPNGMCTVLQIAQQGLRYVYHGFEQVDQMLSDPMATPQSDGYWSQSNSVNGECTGYRARLNVDYSSGCDGWRSVHANANNYVQVYWSQDIIINRIAVQPRRDAWNEYAKTVKLYYHTAQGGGWKWYTEGDENNVRQSTKIIDMFTDGNGPTHHDDIREYTLQKPLLANYMRIYVETWNTYPAMRMEIYGMPRTLVT